MYGAEMRAGLPIISLLLAAACGWTTDWDSAIATFEKDTSLAANDWYGPITWRDVRNETLWVKTTLRSDGEGWALASRICDGYAPFAFEHRGDIRSIDVRAANGDRLAYCGPAKGSG